MEIKKDNEQEEEKKEVEVPNVVGMTKKEAEKTLEDVGLSMDIREDESNTDNQKNIITEQLPKPGIKIKEGTSVIISY